MKVNIKERIMIRPSKETPKRNLWVSDLDLLVSVRHVPLVYFYKQQPNKTSNFFETKLLKDALSEVLVHFYPFAGRLVKDENGRIHINCNGDGALFVEAETTSFLDHFGDFTPCSDMLNLIPSLEDDIFSYPLFAAQLTRFRCGSVSIVVFFHHTIADGTSLFHFINSWSDIARGMSISNPPFIDRSFLQTRATHVRTFFNHIEYDPPPTMINASSQTHDSELTSFKMFKVTHDKINTLKSKLKSGISYSTYAVLTAHVWYCVCKARELCADQETKLYIPTSGRLRFDPPLPSGYFGNVQFTTTVLSSAGEIESKPLQHTVDKIHEALNKMNDGYLRSTLDYLKKQPDIEVLRRGADTYKCPNLSMVSWLKLPIYDADFGWGRPIYMARAKASYEGMCYIIPSPNKNTLLLFICLKAHHMDSFHNLFEGHSSKL
ncbi:HXXXD-type acyl-transferase family protein [Euphorbia peplus]|nr:HXXXD-type acyl-transferase family protein [Euphorbia peplus]